MTVCNCCLELLQQIFAHDIIAWVLYRQKDLEFYEGVLLGFRRLAISTQKVDSAKKNRNRSHAMVRHQYPDALASALMKGIPPWTSAILNIIRGECLS
jgi:hypothetical protein